MDYRKLLGRTAKQRNASRFPPIKSSYRRVSTPDYMRDSPIQNPIIPYPHQLEKMERERQELVAERTWNVIKMADMQEERQEAIRKRICGKIKGYDAPLHQSTKGKRRLWETIRPETLNKD